MKLIEPIGFRIDKYEGNEEDLIFIIKTACQKMIDELRRQNKQEIKGNMINKININKICKKERDERIKKEQDKQFVKKVK